MQKKGILAIAFLLMFTIQAIARVPMKVTMGTVDVFRKESKTLVVFDHSNPNPMSKFRMSTAYSYLAYHLLTLLNKNI